MAEIVYGDQDLSGAMQALAAHVSEERYHGTLYIGYPILTNVDGAVRVDALYVSETAGVIVFDASHLSVSEDDSSALDEVREVQDRYFAAITSKLLETSELLENRRLGVIVTVITLSTKANFKHGDVVVSTVDALPEVIPDAAGLSADKYRVLRSVIERTATIRPVKKRTNVTRKDSRGALLRKIEKNIANLDEWQKRAAIEMPAGPQRIRGLAGSGKTIVLALKAAFIHSKQPDWRIVVTFQTRSLYQQFRRLLTQFSFEFSKQEPDWEKLTVIHAWGSYSSRGVYSEMAQSVKASVKDFSEAKRQYGAGGAFTGICTELLSSISKEKVEPLYDVVLIDEGQDLPQAFFELVYHFTKSPKRIVFAYDELQNLSDFSMKPVEQLFGKKNNGRPNVQLQRQKDGPRQDIILPVCYRNTPWALSIAHGLGFGTAREKGLIQMFDEPSLWKEIGYDVLNGTLAKGQDVCLGRSQQATPRYFPELLDPKGAVHFAKFDDSKSELEWVAERIAENLSVDELEHDDILIVVPEAITIRSTAPAIMRALRKHDIGAHLVGVTTSRDSVFSADSIAITSIYRAKGNEAPVVYVVGADYCHGGFNLARKRNILFTAITRSRAWVRVSGVGAGMQGLIEEYESIAKDDYALEFQYPTEQQLRRMRTLHRDVPFDEVKEIEQDLEGLMRLVQRIDAGEVSIEALPTEAQTLVRRLQNEGPKSKSVRRRTD